MTSRTCIASRVAAALLAAPGGLACHQARRRAPRRKPARCRRGCDNVQLGIAYMRRGDLALAQGQARSRDAGESRRSRTCTARAACFLPALQRPRKADRGIPRGVAAGAAATREFQNNYAVYLCSVGRNDEGVQDLPARRRTIRLYLTPRGCLRQRGRVPASPRITMSRRARCSSMRWPCGPTSRRPCGSWPTSISPQASSPRRARKSTAFIGHQPGDAGPAAAGGASVTRAQHDQLDAQLYARRLQLDFPELGSRRVRWPTSVTTRAEASWRAKLAATRGIGARLRGARERRRPHHSAGRGAAARRPRHSRGAGGGRLRGAWRAGLREGTSAPLRGAGGRVAAEALSGLYSQARPVPPPDLTRIPKPRAGRCGSWWRRR